MTGRLSFRRTAFCLLWVLFSLTFSPLITRGEDGAPGVNWAVTPEDRDCDRFREQSARMEQGDVDLLWVGDSITHFWEDAGAPVFEKYYGKRKTMNFAISGDRTGHVIWRIEHSPMDKIDPKMAVVMIGTNNIGHGSSNPAQTVEGIQKIVAMLKERYPAMKILLLKVFPRGNKPDDPLRVGVNEINDGLEKIYADGGVENVQLYGIGDLMLDADGTLPPEIMPDALHPNAAGYEIWASAIEPLVIEGLGETPEEILPATSDIYWWKDCFNEQCQQLKTKKGNILFFGDSITHNWVRTDDASRALWEKYYGKRGGINLGVGGDTARQVIWRFDHYPLEKVNPKLVVLEMGVNDLTSVEAPKEEVAYANRYLVKKIRGLWPNVPVIVMKLLPFQYPDNEKHSGMEFQRWVDDYNEILPLYFRDIPDVTIVDLSDLYLLPDGKINPDLMPDFVHPNAAGFRLWGERLKDLVNAKLKSSSKPGR